MTRTALYLRHLAVLSCGLLGGLLIAWHLTTIPFAFPGEVEQARALGIVSLSVRANYPKTRDVLNCFFITVLPITGAVGLWLLWGGGRRYRVPLRHLFQEGTPAEEPAAPGRRWLLAAVVAAFLVLTFDVNFFYQPNGAWHLLAEEGQILAWAQSILSGGVYAKDFFCFYGPLFIYPLAGLMRLFEPSIVVERVYTYLLHLAAYGIIIAFLYQTLRSRLTFVLSSGLCLLAFFPTYLSPNSTPLRAALGIAAILLVHAHRPGPSAVRLLATGGLLGLSLLFSQEAGVCATVAVTALLIMHGWTAKTPWGFVRAYAILAAGITIAVSPVVLYLHRHDALAAAVSVLVEYPRLAALGFAALPFPTFSQFVQAPLSGGAFFYYWILAVYVFTAIDVLVLAIVGFRDQKVALQGALLLFGLLLYRAALARSDEIHLYNVCLPAFLLVALLCDKAFIGLAGRSWSVLTATRLLFLLVVASSLVMLFPHSLHFRENPRSVLTQALHPSRKWSRRPEGVTLPDIGRGGVSFDPKTANWIIQIRSALETTTAPGEYVFFFPNEPAYYFLFNRTNPTRFAMATCAITTAQRQEMVADLQRHRPAYVVYSLGTWRIDNIPEAEQMPELTTYIASHYEPAREFGDVRVLRRRPD